MSSSVQLKFSLRTTPTVRSLHLVGSWDNYASQLPMSQDPEKKKSSGAWVGTFKFQPGSLQPGARYWYYYIMDGYHVTHDPARESVVEPTTQRKLNILDIPAGSSKSSSTSSSSSAARQSRRSSHRQSVNVAKGRSLSPSQIKSPRPYRPGQTSSIANETYNKASLEEIQARLGRASLDDSSDDDSSDDDSDDASDVPSLTSSASGRSSASISDVSSSASSCSCERYGITRSGNRVKLDCGGARCGYSDSECSSESEEETYHAKASKRHGVVIRGRN